MVADVVHYVLVDLCKSKVCTGCPAVIYRRRPKAYMLSFHHDITSRNVMWCHDTMSRHDISRSRDTHLLIACWDWDVATVAPERDNHSVLSYHRLIFILLFPFPIHRQMDMSRNSILCSITYKLPSATVLQYNLLSAGVTAYKYGALYVAMN